MNQPSARPPTMTMLREWAERLGSIPVARICTEPWPGTAREEHVLPRHDAENRLFELVDGTLVEKAMGFFEARMAVVLSHFLEKYLEKKDLGVVLGADAMMRLAPGLVRLPDVSFVAWSRFPRREVPPDPVPELAPDLAVEILSEGNTGEEMTRKVREYFAAGARLVWIVDPKTETAAVYSSPAGISNVGIDGALDGGDVLPGFQLSLRAWFQRARRGARE